MKKREDRFEDRLVTGFFRSLWILITWPFKKERGNAEMIARWRVIRELSRRNDEAAWTSAIVKADTLLDEALKIRFAGETMGERLKNARAFFTPDVYDSAWKAHVLRNKIVHEHTQLSRQQAERAIYQFRMALNRLGVL